MEAGWKTTSTTQVCYQRDGAEGYRTDNRQREWGAKGREEKGEDGLGGDSGGSAEVSGDSSIWMRVSRGHQLL